ncbi:hypothetical protein N184_13340 [Sinorhizobium sp. GL28]|nr:hypothetical protein N183_20430 [Sinorhizobium sp. Sb3]KSV83229.1 hypothetical protein N184_13340 [Sinorhizobium sp. GL28]
MPIVLFKTIEYALRILRRPPVVETQGRKCAAFSCKLKIKYYLQQRDDLSLRTKAIV